MNRDVAYPAGTVRDILDTDLVTAPTAKALKRRLRPVERHADLLGEQNVALLTAVCMQLIPQNDRAEPVDLAATLHRDVAAGGGDGWRYAALPADGIALTMGLVGIDESARAMAGNDFVNLGSDERNRVLVSVQQGTAPGATWVKLDPKRWFEELLVAAATIYYSHPLAQEEIGYLGMADAKGWPDVGLGARAAHEPVGQDRP